MAIVNGLAEANGGQRNGNYGWDCREGAHDFETAGCAGATFIEPVAEYGRTLGTSVTGGYVYRGAQPSTLVGRYIFADFGSGRIWAWIPDPANPSSRVKNCHAPGLAGMGGSAWFGCHGSILEMTAPLALWLTTKHAAVERSSLRCRRGMELAFGDHKGKRRSGFAVAGMYGRSR